MSRSPYRQSIAWMHIGTRSLLLAACLISGCAGSLGTTASSHLRAIRESRDPNLRYRAYAGLARRELHDDEESMRETARQLAWQLEKGNEPVATRAMICRTLGQLRLEEGREAVLAQVDHSERVVQLEAIRALGRVGSSDDAATLVRLAHAATSVNARVTAIEALGELKPRDPRVGLSLVDGMEQPDPAIRLASHEALVKIQGKDLGIESKPWRKEFEGRLARENPVRHTATGDPRIRSAAFQTQRQPPR